MTTTKLSTSEDVLYAIAGLLDEYRDQIRRRADAANANAQAAPCPAPPEQTTLPLYAGDDAEAEEEQVFFEDNHQTHEAHVPADEIAPWADLTGIEVVNLLYKLPPEIVAKMDWVIDNVPRMNRQRIVRDAVVAHLDALIARNYKGT